MNNIFNYNDEDTFVHRLSGLSKLISFMALTSTVMLSFDYRVILSVMVFSLIILKISKITFKQIKVILIYVIFFLVINMGIH